MDVRPRIAGEYRTKFKIEALPLKNEVGGIRFLYSHNCVFGLSQVHQADKFSVKTLMDVFPALGVLRTSKRNDISIVSGAIIEEVLRKLGLLKFGKRAEAACNIALWRTWGEQKPLVGEFAYQLKFDSKGPMDSASNGFASNSSSLYNLMCRTGYRWAPQNGNSLPNEGQSATKP